MHYQYRFTNIKIIENAVESKFVQVFLLSSVTSFTVLLVYVFQYNFYCEYDLGAESSKFPFVLANCETSQSHFPMVKIFAKFLFASASADCRIRVKRAQRVIYMRNVLYLQYSMYL
jgi:hypothetical protein